MRFIVVFAIALMCFEQARARTIEVCADCSVQSIKKAMNKAFDGDTLIINEGIYKEGNIVINKKLTLIGKGFPVLDGEGKTEIITIKADSVIIMGLQIQNVGTSYIKDQAGINIVESDGCIIQNNKLLNTFFGVYIQKSSGCIISDNEIIGEAEQEISSGNAVHLWYCNDIIVKDNMIKHHRDGIYLEFVDNSRITGNLSENNLRYGLHFMFSNDDQYLNNTFRSNGAGVAVMFSKKIEMKYNLFEKNWGSASYGLLLKEIYDSEIEENEFIENTVGIYAEGATRCMITNNEFSGNGWALKILGSSMDNTFTMNNFFSNTFDLSTNSSRNTNTYYKNYWSAYTGYDLDKNGIGDVPYHPVKLFSYVVNRVEPSIVLLRSLFVDIINFAEKVAPAITPETLVDPKPLMKPVS